MRSARTVVLTAVVLMAMASAYVYAAGSKSGKAVGQPGTCAKMKSAKGAAACPCPTTSRAFNGGTVTVASCAQGLLIRILDKSGQPAGSVSVSAKAGGHAVSLRAAGKGKWTGAALSKGASKLAVTVSKGAISQTVYFNLSSSTCCAASGGKCPMMGVHKAAAGTCPMAKAASRGTTPPKAK